MGNKNVKKAVSVAVLLMVCGVGIFNLSPRVDPPVRPGIKSEIQPRVDPPVRPTDK